MCNLKTHGFLSKRPILSNLTVLTMEIPLEIIGYFSFDVTGINISFSGHTLSVEVLTNHR